MLMDSHPQRIDLRAQGGISAHIVDDLAYAGKQPGIIQYRLAHAYAVLTELSSFTDQSGRMG
jgi:hypothetical protein